MARVKRGVTSHAKHKKVLEQAKGFYGRRKNTIRAAKACPGPGGSKLALIRQAPPKCKRTQAPAASASRVCSRRNARPALIAITAAGRLRAAASRNGQSRPSPE